MKKFFLCASDRARNLDDVAGALFRGQSRDHVLEEVIRGFECDSSDHSLGFGGFPNVLGTMELDAAFMDGDTRNVGAVAGLTNFLPVRIARRLMQQELHTLLVGVGAEIFARESGFEPESTLSDAQREKWEREVKPLIDERGQKSLVSIVRQLASSLEGNLDTTIMIAGDGKGISGAASTSGWPYKHPGRVGDTPIIGAGLYVDSRYGGSCSTHTGEMSTRIGAARLVVAQMELGKQPRDALYAAIDDLSSLNGGLLRTLVLHAIDPDGNVHVVAVNSPTPVFYQYWKEGLSKPGCRQAEAISLSFS